MARPHLSMASVRSGEHEIGAIGVAIEAAGPVRDAVARHLVVETAGDVDAGVAGEVDGPAGAVPVFLLVDVEISGGGGGGEDEEEGGEGKLHCGMFVVV